MKHFIRFFRYYIYVLLLFCFALIGTLHYFIHSTFGAELFIHIVELFTRGAFNVHTVKGNLYDGLLLTQLHFQNNSIEANVDTLYINWQPTSLLKEQLQIHSLKVEGATLQVHPSANSGSPIPTLLKVFEIPIQVENFEASDIIFKDYNHQSYSLAHLYSQLEWKGMSMIFHTLQVEALDGYMHAKGKLSLPRFAESNLTADWNFIYQNTPIAGLATIEIPVDEKSPMLLTIHSLSNQQNGLSYELKGTGTLDDHQIQATFKDASTQFHVDLTGQITETQWIMQILHLKALIDNHPIEVHHQPVFSLEPHTALFKNVCFTVDTLDACLNGKILEPFDKKELQLEATFKSPTLEPIAPFFELEGLKGAVDGQITIDGTLLKPDIKLALQVKNGTYLIPGLNLLAREVEGTFDSTPDFNFILKAKGRVHHQPVTLEGEGTIANEPHVTLHIQGDDLILSDTPEITVNASPHLTLEINNQQLTLLGDISVTQARIHLKEKGRALSPSTDAYVVDPHKGSTEPPFIIRTDLMIHLGNNVNFSGYGFKAKASGDLKIHGIDDDLRALGDIILSDGKYEAYKRILNLKEGRLRYTHNALFNPYLMIRAERAVPVPYAETRFPNLESITLGVQVSGNIQTPNIMLYSVPSMSQADILGYMVFGRSSDLASAAEAEVLLQVAQETASLLGMGNDSVVSQIKEKFGFDELSIQTEKGEIERENIPNMAVNLGKKLSDSLYFQYSYGFAEALSTLKLRYQLSRRFSLVGSTNELGSGGDIVYRIEKD